MPDYRVNWIRFVAERVQSATRKVIHLAWLGAVIAPVKVAHTALLNFRYNMLVMRTVTGQVRILEYWLNYTFDDPGFRIIIKDAEESEPLFVFLEIENRPVY